MVMKISGDFMAFIFLGLEQFVSKVLDLIVEPVCVSVMSTPTHKKFDDVSVGV